MPDVTITVEIRKGDLTLRRELPPDIVDAPTPFVLIDIGSYVLDLIAAVEHWPVRLVT